MRQNNAVLSGRQFGTVDSHEYTMVSFPFFCELSLACSRSLALARSFPLALSLSLSLPRFRSLSHALSDCDCMYFQNFSIVFRDVCSLYSVAIIHRLSKSSDLFARENLLFQNKARSCFELANHCHPVAECDFVLQHTATHCNTLEHTATHCNTLQQNTPCSVFIATP